MDNDTLGRLYIIPVTHTHKRKRYAIIHAEKYRTELDTPIYRSSGGWTSTRIGYYSTGRAQAAYVLAHRRSTATFPTPQAAGAVWGLGAAASRDALKRGLALMADR